MKGDKMRLLVCASARPEIIEKCLQEMTPENQVFAAVATGSAERISRFMGNSGVCIRLKGPSFCQEDYTTLQEYGPFDVVVVVSGGSEFTGFSNVIAAISGLSFSHLVFYNSSGYKEIVPMQRKTSLILKQYGTVLLFRFFQVIRPIELLAERIMIQCAELLGLKTKTEQLQIF